MRLAQSLFVMVVMVFSFYLSGCTTKPLGSRFYSSPPSPQNDVAILRSSRWARFTSINGLAINIVSRGMQRGRPNLLEVLPGQHVIGVDYFYYEPKYHTGGSVKETGEVVYLNINAQPGHLYLIYSEHPTEFTWNPVIVDVASDEDYEKLGKLGFDGPGIREQIKNYFRGERHVYPYLKDHLKGR